MAGVVEWIHYWLEICTKRRFSYIEVSLLTDECSRIVLLVLLTAKYKERTAVTVNDTEALIDIHAVPWPLSVARTGLRNGSVH